MYYAFGGVKYVYKQVLEIVWHYVILGKKYISIWDIYHNARWIVWFYMLQANITISMIHENRYRIS